MKLAVVTATIDYQRARSCLESWRDRSTGQLDYYVLQQEEVASPWELLDSTAEGRLFAAGHAQILGVVPAFAIGVQRALEDGAEIIACLHDDLDIEEDGWDEKVLWWFDTHATCGLAGFGGAKGLGSDDLYRSPYNPMQLARQDFVSNMRHAEAHGRRATSQGDWRWPLAAERVACLDGFSQIGRAEFWKGYPDRNLANGPNLFQVMQQWGLIHHAYDAALGCFAARLGWEAWMLPIACHHYGGRTAVMDSRYQQWADAERDKKQLGLKPPFVPWEGTGDQLFWTEAHQIVYREFRDVLPVRTGER